MSNDAGEFRGNAGGVFYTAAQLAEDFNGERSELRDGLSKPDWRRHHGRFQILMTLFVDVKPGMIKPPDGFEAVAKHLVTVAQIARKLNQQTIQNSGEYLDFSPELAKAAEQGMAAVKEGADYLSGDPFRFLDAQDQKPQEGTVVLLSASALAAGREPTNSKPDQYLGIVLGDREATRIVNGKEITIPFGDKAKPWELLKLLVDAGEQGIHRREVEDSLQVAPDKHKRTLLDLIEELKLDIDLDNGIWTLAELGMP